MSHDCKCECKHKNVKYCKKCNKVYCLDCSKEWPERESNWVYPYWQSYPPYIYQPDIYQPYEITWTGDDAGTITYSSTD